MKKIAMFVTGTVLMAFVALPLFARGDGCGSGWRDSDCPRYERATGYQDCPYYGTQGSNLTQEQRTQLDALRDEYRTNTEKLRDQLRDKRYELMTQLRSSTPDEASVRELQAEISTLRAEMDKAWIDHSLKVKKVNPDAQPGFGKGHGRMM